MACEIFKLRTAQKSRGWLRFQRFFDEIDRIAPNFFFENCAPPEKIFVEPIRTEISARPIRDRRPDRTGPDFGTDPTDRTNIDLIRYVVTAVIAVAHAAPADVAAAAATTDCQAKAPTYARTKYVRT